MIRVVAVLAALAAGPALPPGHVQTAKSGTDVLLVWDAAPVIEQIVQNETSDDDGLKIVEADGSDILNNKASVYAAARTLTLKVVYPKTSFGAPKYGLQTSDLDEMVVTMTARRDDVRKYGQKWHAMLAAGTIPPQIRVQLVGAFPAQH